MPKIKYVKLEVHFYVELKKKEKLFNAHLPAGHPHTTIMPPHIVALPPCLLRQSCPPLVTSVANLATFTIVL